MPIPSLTRIFPGLTALALLAGASACTSERGVTAALPDGADASETDMPPRDGAWTAASEGEPTSEPEPSSTGPTYASDVRPILTRACLTCHRQGGVAPFAFDTYAKAKQAAALIAGATRARTMPPTGIDNSGDCNTFRDTTYLTDEEIATIGTWAEGGAPEGDVAKPAPAVPSVPMLEGDVRTVKTPVYTPSTARADDYRCFVIDSPFTENTNVTGFDTKPGSMQAHHMVVFYPMDDLTASLAVMKDALEPGPGYTCFGTPGIPATVIAAWTPGSGATLYPDQTGMGVVPKRPLIVQMHYNTAHGMGLGPDSTRIDFSVKKDGITPITFVNLIDLEMNLQPGLKEVDEVFTRTISGMRPNITKPVQIVGVYPHMHELGYRQVLTIAGAGQSEEACMVDVPNYEFNWQRMYMFDKPVTVQPTDLLKLTCKYDTSARTTVTKWGEGTQDEMCVMGLLVKQ